MTQHHLEILPLSRHRWIVRYEGDSTPLSEHPTLTEARAEARNHARQFGESTIPFTSWTRSATRRRSSRTSARRHRPTSRALSSSPSVGGHQRW